MEDDKPFREFTNRHHHLMFSRINHPLDQDSPQDVQDLDLIKCSTPCAMNGAGIPGGVGIDPESRIGCYCQTLGGH